MHTDCTAPLKSLHTATYLKLMGLCVQTFSLLLYMYAHKDTIYIVAKSKENMLAKLQQEEQIVAVVYKTDS